MVSLHCVRRTANAKYPLTFIINTVLLYKKSKGCKGVLLTQSVRFLSFNKEFVSDNKSSQC